MKLAKIKQSPASVRKDIFKAVPVSMVQLTSCFISSKALGKCIAIELAACAKFLPWNRTDCTNNEAFPSEGWRGKSTGLF